MATFELGPGYLDHPFFVGAVELVVALLMVSRLPTYSIKRIRIPHRHVMAALLVFGLLAATLVSIPWITLLGVGAVYIGSMPIARGRPPAAERAAACAQRRRNRRAPGYAGRVSGSAAACSTRPSDR